MGREARRNAQASALPQGQWCCIWCDRMPPDATFKSREHVMPESLGAERDFRLLRGVVCDTCNKGVLKQIDDDLNHHPAIRGLRFALGLGSELRELQPGIRREGDGITFAPQQLAKNTRLRMDLVLDGGGTVSLRTSGPSGNPRAEHLPRGLHRMAYNAIAHAVGPSSARNDYEHLRAYVLAGVDAPMRAYLLDQRTLNETLRSRGSWTTGYELLGEHEKPNAMLLRLGRLFCYVSLELTTRPLAGIRARYPWLTVAGTIDD